MREKDYWEEAWLTSCTSIHDHHCTCGDWRNHLWTLCALDDADLAAAAAITERDEADGGEDFGFEDGDPGDAGGSVACTSLPRESKIPALLTRPILSEWSEQLHTPNTPGKEESRRKLEIKVSPLPLSVPSVQLHQQPTRSRRSSKPRKPRKKRKERVRPVSRVPKALLREMDRLMSKQRDALPESESSSYFSEDSLTDPWTTSDDDFQSDPDPLTNKRKKRLQF
uniref:ORF2/2 n=2 Tax=Torque teno sus virus 1a TaxID=687386 RepID=E2IVP7_9VIRU|nr:ORF2/2 [Torque teno sus virus 1a]AXV43486.1 ORF2/2 [Torque teno sus virus 1a]